MLAWKIAPGARGGQHRRAQAGRDDVADGAALRRDRAAGRPAAGVVNIVTGAGETGAALVRHPDVEQGRVHRVDRRRPRDRQGGRRHRQEAHARARRQGREHRVRRRADRPGDRGHRQRHLLQPGPRLLRRQPPARAGDRSTTRSSTGSRPACRRCASATRSTRTPTSARSTRASSSSASASSATSARPRAPSAGPPTATSPRTGSGSRRRSSTTSRRATASPARRSSARCCRC